MPRKYKPVELPLRPIEGVATVSTVKCPRCEATDVDVLGRIGLRLVFRCQQCRVRFFRRHQSAEDEQIVAAPFGHGGWVRVS
jgi:hypothetical protein